VQVVKANEGSRQHMLSGMLLHVVAAARGVDLAADAGSGREIFDRSFQVVDDSAIFRVGDFRDSESLVAVDGDRADVEDLSSASRVKGGTIEDEGWTLACGDLFDFGVEVVEEGVVVVETVGHGELLFYL
jgi:hypothetical protein